MRLKQYWPLFVGVGLPFLTIIYIFCVTYIPSFFNKPGYDFLYTKGCSYYDSNMSVSVEEGKVVEHKPSSSDFYDYGTNQCTIYLYNVESDSNTQLSLDQSQQYTLLAVDKSPDGYKFTTGNENNLVGFPFSVFSPYNRGWYLEGHGIRRKVTDDTYDVKFLGWIKQ